MPVREHALWIIAIRMTDLALGLATVLQAHGHQELAQWATRQVEDARDDLSKEACLAQIQPERIGCEKPCTEPPWPSMSLNGKSRESGS